MSNNPSEADDRASWTALTANAEEEAAEDLEFFDDLPARISAARAPDSGGANLGGVGITMASATALVGCDAIAPLL